MNFSGPSAVGIASDVWTQPARTLTGIGGNALFFSAHTQALLPPSQFVDLRPLPTQGAWYSIATFVGAGANGQVILIDGSNGLTVYSMQASVPQFATLVATNTVWIRIVNNSTTVSVNYMFSGIVFAQ